MFVVCANLAALAVIKPPVEADIVVGDIQPLGVPMSFGGPHAGYMACKETYMRQLPGRLVGRTVDAEGKQAFTLTIQTREQHIKREKATSNICSNQSLIALSATLYLSLLGEKGFREASVLSANMAHALSKMLNGKGIRTMNKNFFNEFVVEVNNADQYLAKLKAANIILFAINHVNAKIEINPFSHSKAQIGFLKQGETLPGGNSALYLANNMIRVDDGTKLKSSEGIGVDGKIVNIEIIKSRTNAAGRSVPMVFVAGEGFDPIWSLYMLLKSTGGITSGSYGTLRGYEDFKFRHKEFKSKLFSDSDFAQAFNIIAKEELEKFKNVNIDNLASENLADISSIKIDTKEPIEKRCEKYFDTVKNPYAFRVGKVGVKVNFVGSNDFADSLANLASKN